MKNITVKVTDVAYLRARVWAAEHETSVSAAVTWFLEDLPRHKGAARRFSRENSAQPESGAAHHMNDRESPSAPPSAPASTTLANS